MITRVYGNANGFDINLKRKDGDLEVWETDIPADKDGRYIVDIYAEKDNGLVGYIATVYFLISGHKIKGKLVQKGYKAETDNTEYESLLNIEQVIGELAGRCFSAKTDNTEYESLLNIERVRGELAERCFSEKTSC